jgi:hypothetical protein
VENIDENILIVKKRTFSGHNRKINKEIFIFLDRKRL